MIVIIRITITIMIMISMTAGTHPATLLHDTYSFHSITGFTTHIRSMMCAARIYACDVCSYDECAHRRAPHCTLAACAMHCLMHPLHHPPACTASIACDADDEIVRVCKQAMAWDGFVADKPGQYRCEDSVMIHQQRLKQPNTRFFQSTAKMRWGGGAACSYSQLQLAQPSAIQPEKRHPLLRPVHIDDFAVRP
jgi:hypothetical protein